MIANNLRPDWWIVGWCAFLLSMVVHTLASSILRRRAIKRFAVLHNLAFASDLLPSGLSLSRTSFGAKRYSIANCLWGDVGGIPLTIFDLSYRKGKASLSQTIVAFRRDGQTGIPEPPIDGVGSFEFEEAGDWVIGYVPKRVVRPEEMEDWCIELHTLARDLLNEASGSGQQRPHLFRWLT